MDRSSNPPKRGSIFFLVVLVVCILIVATILESRRNLDLTRNLKDLKADYRNLERLHIEAKKETEQVREILSQFNKGQGPTNLPIISQVEPFNLRDQTDKQFTLKNLMGKIWVADIIFTRCPGPCQMMTRSLSGIQKEIPADWPVHFVTLTTDPEFDTPSILGAYAKRFDANPERWSFLSGNKKDIERLAAKNLKMIATPKTEPKRNSPTDLFIHTERFMLVDPHGRLRASFDHNDPDHKSKLLDAINNLRNEMNVEK